MIQFDYILDYIDLVFDLVYKSICHDITYFILICLHIMYLNRSKNTVNHFLYSIKFAPMFAGQKRKPGAIRGQKKISANYHMKDCSLLVLQLQLRCEEVRSERKAFRLNIFHPLSAMQHTDTIARMQ